MTSTLRLDKQLSVLEYAAIAMILISSGTAYFYWLHAGITIMSLFAIAVIVAIRKHAKVRSNVFIIIYSLLIPFTGILYGCSIQLISYAILLFSTLLISASFSYDQFRKGLLNVVAVMAVISISLEILFLLGIIKPVLHGSGVNGLFGFYIYMFHVFGGGHNWTTTSRLCGIFWEPGIYQMVLNICLLMNLELFDKNSEITWKLPKLCIIVIAIIMTESTTGYLVLGLIIVGRYLNKSKRSLKFKVLTIILLILFWIVISINPVITEKFSDDNHSFLVRFIDFQALLKMIWENPFFGSGVYSKTFEYLGNKFGLTGAQSAGFLLQTAQFGIFWIIAYYFSVIKEFKKRRIKLPSYVYVIIITFLGLGEPLAFSPLMLMNVLPFKKYD